MRLSRNFVPAAALVLAACSGEAELDTDYEEQLPAPVQDSPEGEPVPANDSIEGGKDEQIDAQYSGDAVPVEEVPEQ